ncbi:hypothetical protein MPSEU_000687900 [Mayamaea pseudoterrestris]|nr:hypothetical protein MPSEU_000687900 [Mayamaea pseudoterrestris]
MKFLLVAILACTASAFHLARPSVTARPSTQLYEDFGFSFAEQTYENQPDPLKGEAEYKQWVNKFAPDNLMNRKYNVIRRVRELDLLKATAEQGILSKLEAQGLSLETIEEILPLAEKLGLLSLAGNNQQLLVNGVAPLVVEGAPILLPLVSGALAVGPPAFYLAAAGTASLELFLLSSHAEIPFVGLSAGAVLGLLLVPATVALAAVGAALGSLKIKK